MNKFLKGMIWIPVVLILGFGLIAGEWLKAQANGRVTRTTTTRVGAPATTTRVVSTSPFGFGSSTRDLAGLIAVSNLTSPYGYGGYGYAPVAYGGYPAAYGGYGYGYSPIAYPYAPVSYGAYPVRYPAYGYGGLGSLIVLDALF